MVIFLALFLTPTAVSIALSTAMCEDGWGGALVVLSLYPFRVSVQLAVVGIEIIDDALLRLGGWGRSWDPQHVSNMLAVATMLKVIGRVMNLGRVEDTFSTNLA